MWPDRVSNSGPLTYESGALPTALRGSLRQYSVYTEVSPTDAAAEKNRYDHM